MNRTAALLLLAPFILLGACESSGPQPRPAADPVAAVPPPPLEEQVKSLATHSRPGAKHTALGPLAGSFDVTVADVAADGGETQRFHGAATLAWILGGRFLRWDANVDFHGTLGTTTGFLGYDSRLDEYELLMISDLAQGMAVASGHGDISGKGLLFTLEQLDPRSGVRVRSRSRLRVLGPDHFILQQLEPDASGDEHATRVWHYRRVPEIKR
jgi:hypothetical protein